MASQKIPTSNIQEVIRGVPLQPPHAITSLSPSTGSVNQSPPNISRVVGIDLQLTTMLLTAGAGAFTAVSWPAVGFTGLLSGTQRFYNNGQASTIIGPLSNNANVVASNSTTLAAGQSTQLCLLCNVQSYSSTTPILMGQVSLATRASTTQIVQTKLNGPWFSSGLVYTAFSCIPASTIYTPTAVTNLPVSLAISAQLYACFVQN